ncbi:MAG: asparagine synthase-related protein [Candidatus Omnitrophota bacterium]
MENITRELKRLIKNNVTAGKDAGLLFSGGLDSAILAHLSPDSKAITVSLESSGEDLGLSRAISGFIGMEHHIVDIKIQEAIESVPEVIKILESFDPALPNDLVVYFGLKKARDLGMRTVMTGDGSDELFAGYDYMRGIKDLDGYIKRISKEMSFSSNIIGNHFGIEIVQPFIQKEVIEFALSIGHELKIKRDGDGTCGKWILRKAFEGALPGEFIWQGKRPLEVGSGMTGLRRILTEEVSNEEFKGREYPVKFFNREHLYYYKAYRSVIGDIPSPKDGQKSCLGCGAGIRPNAIHCRVCGYVYDWQ